MIENSDVSSVKTFQQKLGTNTIAYSGMAINIPVAIAEIEDKKV